MLDLLLLLGQWRRVGGRGGGPAGGLTNNYSKTTTRKALTDKTISIAMKTTGDLSSKGKKERKE